MVRFGSKTRVYLPQRADRVVQEREEDIETFGTLVACADIRGPQIEGRMVVAIGSLAGSGLAGVAILEEDGDLTNITTYFVPQVNAEPQTQPAGQTTPIAVTPQA